MTQELIPLPGKRTRTKVRDLLSKHSVDDPAKANAKRERFLFLLKNRYGYTNEKAVGELERLLKQFYKMNKSLGIHRTRPDFTLAQVASINHEELNIKLQAIALQKGVKNEKGSGIVDRSSQNSDRVDGK
jgi:hypothetical protein